MPRIPGLPLSSLSLLSLLVVWTLPGSLAGGREIVLDIYNTVEPLYCGHLGDLGKCPV